jgi:hypothetical protein
LFCFQSLLSSSKGLKVSFYSFATLLLVVAIAEARFFVVNNHEAAMLQHGQASSRLLNFLDGAGCKGAYFPEPNANKTVSKILGLEFQSLSGKYFFTDVSNYAFQPDSLLIDKQPFVRIMPFYKYSRLRKAPSNSIMEVRKNFLAYSQIDLLLVHHSQGSNAKEITDFALDSLNIPELNYTIYKLK